MFRISTFFKYLDKKKSLDVFIIRVELFCWRGGYDVVSNWYPLGGQSMGILAQYRVSSWQQTPSTRLQHCGPHSVSQIGPWQASGVVVSGSSISCPTENKKTTNKDVVNITSAIKTFILFFRGFMLQFDKLHLQRLPLGSLLLECNRNVPTYARYAEIGRNSFAW